MKHIFLSAQPARRVVAVGQEQQGHLLAKVTPTLHGLLLTASIATLVLIGLLAWHPFGLDATMHNTLVLSALSMLCITLSAAACCVRSPSDWARFVVHAVIIGFLVRSIPVLMLAYPPLHDGYFYYASLINLTNTYSLEPVLQSWYSDIGRQLHWPVLQLITAQVYLWTGAPLDELWRYIAPALGALTVVAIGLVAYQIFGNWRIAAIAGLSGSFSDLVLYYQSEYHPQGLAIVIVTFLIYMILTSRASNVIGVRFLMLLVGCAFLFSHHASSLVLPLLLAPILILPVLSRIYEGIIQPKREGSKNASYLHSIMNDAKYLVRFRQIIFVVLVAAITQHIYLSSDILKLGLQSLSPFFWGMSATGEANSAVGWIGLLRTTKYVLLALGFIGVVLTLRKPNVAGLILTIIIGMLLLGSVLGSVILPDAAARFLALLLPLTAIFSAVPFNSLIHVWKSRPYLAYLCTILTLSIYVGANILNSYAPAYFLDGTPRSAGIWYGNALPNTEHLAAAGRWLRDNTPEGARYGVDFSTRMVPFFFGGRPDRQLVYKQTRPDKYCTADYLVVDYALDTNDLLLPRVTIDYSNHTRVYDNGSVAILQRTSEAACRAQLHP